MTSSSARFDDLQHKFEENPRRYFASLANEFRRAGNARRAVELCRTFLPQMPEHLSGHVVLAQALQQLGADDEARGAYERVLALDPENVLAVQALGELAAARGDEPEARRWYARAVELDPRDPEAARRLAALDAPAPSPAEPSPAAAAAAAFAAGDAEETPEVVEPTAPSAGADATPDELRYLDDQQSAEEFTAGFFATVLEENRAAPADHATTDSPLAELDAAAVYHGEPAAQATRSEAASEKAEADREEAMRGEAPPADEPAARDAAPAPALPDARDDEGAERLQPAAADDVRGTAPALGPGPTAETSDDQAAAGDAEDEPRVAFVTETMAELYLRQGFRAQALQVYRQLLAQSPEDERLRARVAELETAEESRPAGAAEPAATPEPALVADRPEAGETAEVAALIAEGQTPTVSEWLARLVEARPDEATSAGPAPADPSSGPAPDPAPEPEEALVAAVADVPPLTDAVAEPVPERDAEALVIEDLHAAAAAEAREPTPVEPQAPVEPALTEPAAAEQAWEDRPAVEQPRVEWLESEPPVGERDAGATSPARAEEEPAVADDVFGWPEEARAHEQAGSAPPAGALAEEVSEAVTEEFSVEGWPVAERAGAAGVAGDLGEVTPLAPAAGGLPEVANEVEEAPEGAPDAASSDDPFAWDDVPAASAPRAAEPLSLEALSARPATPADVLAAGALTSATVSLQNDALVDAQLSEAVAEDPLALDQLLRSSPPGGPTPTSVASLRQGASFSFEQFFRVEPTAGAPAGGGAGPSPAPAAEQPAERRRPDDDLDEFHAWLEGLSRS